ncbi:MAG: flagellar hook basal-body protein [Chthoniobacteraceae bacterium]
MIQGIYQGAASMDALERWQSTIADNLASGSVAGYKKDDTSFSGVAMGLTKLNANGAFSVAQGPQEKHSIDTTQGMVQQTGKDTDIAVEGSGFFQVQGPTGTKGYTRDGEFHFNAEGTLVTSSGLKVMGDGGNPISVDMTQGPVSVSHAGQLSQNGNIVGKIPLYDASASDQLQRAASGLMVTKDGSARRRRWKSRRCFRATSSKAMCSPCRRW